MISALLIFQLTSCTIANKQRPISLGTGWMDYLSDEVPILFVLLQIHQSSTEAYWTLIVFREYE